MAICLAVSVLLLWPRELMAQVNMGLTYNSTSVGKNITMNAGKRTADHEFGLGLGLNIREKLDHPGIYENIYPTDNAHYLNFNFYYHRYIFDSWEGISPFILYDLQVKHSTSQTENTQYPTDSTGSINYQLAYREHTALGPFTYLENSIGVGFEARITNSWFLRQKAGLTTTVMFGETEDNRKITSSPEWIYGVLLNLGILYRFNEDPQKPQ